MVTKRILATLQTLVLCLLLAGGQTAAEEESLTAMLKAAVPADTRIVFPETDNERYPALLQAAERFEALGGILLLSDTDSQQQWLQQTHALRLYLAEQGWLTLTLPLPLTPQHLNAQATESFAELQAAHQTQTLSRIQEGLRLLEQQDLERVLVIAMGRSAEWASLYLQQNPAEPQIRLILINPRPAEDTEHARLLERLTALDMTVIDLYREPYAAGQRALPDARMRRNAMRQAGQTDYHQQRIKDPWSGWNPDMTWLKRQVRGLIQAHILNPDEQHRQQRINVPETDQRPPGIRRD